MKVVFCSEFPHDQRKFEADYGEISPALAGWFRAEIDEAIVAIKAAPNGAGHFLHTGSAVVPEFRRRNPRENIPIVCTAANPTHQTGRPQPAPSILWMLCHGRMCWLR